MKQTKEQKVDFEVTCMLNRLGLAGIDWSNMADNENNKKIAEVKKLVLELSKTLPRV